MFELPRPTEEELQGFKKAYYIDRMLSEKSVIHSNINPGKLIDMLLENYDSWILTGKPKLFKK